MCWKVSITWPDEHISEYEAEWLKKRCFSEEARAVMRADLFLPGRNWIYAMLVSNARGLTLLVLTVLVRSACVRTRGTQLKQWQQPLVSSAPLCMHYRDQWLSFPSSTFYTSERCNQLGWIYFPENLFFPENVSRSHKWAMDIEVCECCLKYLIFF